MEADGGGAIPGPRASLLGTVGTLGSGKVCGTFVPAVVRSHPPCVIPVTAQVVWVATQVVWVAFVCLITGVEIYKTGLLLIFF